MRATPRPGTGVVSPATPAPEDRARRGPAALRPARAVSQQAPAARRRAPRVPLRAPRVRPPARVVPWRVPRVPSLARVVRPLARVVPPRALRVRPPALAVRLAEAPRAPAAAVELRGAGSEDSAARPASPRRPASPVSRAFPTGGSAARRSTIRAGPVRSVTASAPRASMRCLKPRALTDISSCAGTSPTIRARRFPAIKSGSASTTRPVAEPERSSS